MKREAKGEKAQSPTRRRSAMAIVVWVLRIGVGAVFMLSGLVKAIDVWGTVFKFEEYFTAWDVTMPMPLTVLAAMALCSAEFLGGAMLALGCFRRLSVWLLTAIMAVMLPLSVYIWLADPVSDCGCFGEFLILSNGATFAKNIVITVALVYLILYNRKVSYLFHPYSQWICGVACLVFATLVELYGFNVQPMIDFRSFGVGTSLSDDESDSEEEMPEFEFIYEKDGSQSRFTADSLPDSTWTFVDREVVGEDADYAAPDKTSVIVSDETGEDVTADVIGPDGLQMLVVVPQYQRADLYYVSFTNELDDMMARVGGSLVMLSDIPTDSIAGFRDMSLVDFPIYHAESTVLKELSRGVVSVVLLRDGVIRWKRNMTMIDVEALVEAPDTEAALEALKPDGADALTQWALALTALLLAVLIFDKALMALMHRGRLKKKPYQEPRREADESIFDDSVSEAENNSVNLQNDTDGPDEGPDDKQ